MKQAKVFGGVMILAAGKGKRMHSGLPKVLHEIGGQALLCHVLDRVREALPSASVAIVLGYGKDEVVRVVKRWSGAHPGLDISFIEQKEQLGTGHAARCAMESPWGRSLVGARLQVMVLPGDLPLIKTDLISQMAEPLARQDALRLLTCELPDPIGYGRVVRRGKKGSVLRITEEKDATLREKAIQEVALSIYLFQSGFLASALQRLSNKNVQGEFYLTDVLSQAVRAKKRVDILQWRDLNDVKGVNDPWELAVAARVLNQRTLEKWARLGVVFTDPGSTRVDTSVELGEEVKIGQGTELLGATRVGRGAILGSRVVLNNVSVGAGANIKTGTVAEDSSIGESAQIGPYAHLRPGSEVGASTKIGNFVELKKTRVGVHTSIAHLSYLGDAEVGSQVNIGCGFVTCNFDGRIIDGQRKHKTIIEDDVFLGSDCQAIAPVKIGRGAYVASGSTITDDVEAGALAIARSRQVNKPGYANKLKEIENKE